MAPQWMVAQDTFSTDLESGAVFQVTKGQHLPAGHEVVAKDEGRNFLFKPLDTGEPEAPAKVSKLPSRKGA